MPSGKSAFFQCASLLNFCEDVICRGFTRALIQETPQFRISLVFINDTMASSPNVTKILFECTPCSLCLKCSILQIQDEHYP